MHDDEWKLFPKQSRELYYPEHQLRSVGLSLSFLLTFSYSCLSLFALFISFNVYIIVFYGLAVCATRGNFFAWHVRLDNALEKSHVSHIFNNFIAANMLKSPNPRRRMEGFVECSKVFSLFSFLLFLLLLMLLEPKFSASFRPFFVVIPIQLLLRAINVSTFLRA